MILDDWQLRLDTHFKELRQNRTRDLGDQPVYALEHGLSETERGSLADEIRARISDSWPEEDHWLAWVVYTTELGYNYDGEEYWQSFERRTPGWTLRGSRDWIRDCFWKFHKQFNGAIPTGRWADHFSIICWPITHAILPLDLQRQLAQSLYEMRYSFRAELLQSPELLGQQIAIGSWKFSSRFRILAQQPLLLGQIATALLLREDERARSLILPACLVRIARDLDNGRREREWLQDAQGVARAHLHGVLKSAVRAKETEERSASDELRSLGLEPSVFLRPASGSWEVVLEIPDLAPLLSNFPSLRGSLDESLCWVSGSSGRPLARGRLFHFGSQMVALNRWPSPSEILLRFEKSCPEIEYLLSAECMLRPGPVWLHKISPDGYAYEIKGKAVRPGCRYILLKNDGPIPEEIGGKPLDIQCEGISAVLIDLPSTLDEPGLQRLAHIGLNPATRLQISPVGIPPAKWDGEGRVEWLSTDKPCICLSGDRPLKGILLNLQGPNPQTLELTVDSPREPLFFELEELPPGNHKLHVLLQLSDSPDDFLSGLLDLTIRNPRVWTGGLTEQNPLFVILDPPNPSLERLWSGGVGIELHGPANRAVFPQMQFFQTRVSAQPSFRMTMPKLSLPVTASAWQSYFKEVQQDRALQYAFDDAVRLEILFNAEELGQFRLICEKESSPLRWSIRWENHCYVLRLFDDTGEPSVRVVHYEFERPDFSLVMEAKVFLDVGHRILEAGGLFVASTSCSTSAMVVPPVIRGLGELKVHPHLSSHPGSSEPFAQLLSLRNIWADARITGDPISSSWQKAVVECLMTEILRSICGTEWVQVEKSLLLHPDRIAQLKTLIWNQPPGASLGATLFAKRDEIAGKTTSERVKEFSRLVRNYLHLPVFEPTENALGSPDDWIAEFALRLVTSPHNVPAWSRQRFQEAMDYIFKWPQLPRSARVLALCIASPASNRNSPIIRTSQWGWP